MFRNNDTIRGGRKANFPVYYLADRFIEPINKKITENVLSVVKKVTVSSSGVSKAITFFADVRNENAIVNYNKNLVRLVK